MTHPRHVVFGTAGHVDHGKSALVLALTGTDPDRLAEEKLREMTIDLGFAFLSLPGLAEPVAIVDVPGHEMFVRNMVAGATGVDAAILVVDANEGVRPQTVEHLEVLCQLGLATGVIALTKVDKASPERITAATAEVREFVAGTFLAQAPLLPVSALTGAGLPELCRRLAQVAQEVTTRSDQGPFRLSIDRAFVMKGAGTVVTGTVLSGRLRPEERVALLPRSEVLRVRAVQVHGQTAPEVTAGQRAAINLVGVEKGEIVRGDVLVTPGSFAPSLMLDVRVNLSRHAPRPVAPRTRVRLHHGTAEVMARIVLLDCERLPLGGSALAQLRLESPLVAAAGDAFVLRSYSPMQVIGGGRVLEAHPPKRRRAAGAEQVAEREVSRDHSAVQETLLRAGIAGRRESELQQSGNLTPEALLRELTRLKEEDSIVPGRGGLWVSVAAVEEMAGRIVTALVVYHHEHPHWLFAQITALAREAAAGAHERETFRLALARLHDSGAIVTAGERVRLASHQPRWQGAAAEAREALLGQLGQGMAYGSLSDLARACGETEAECRALLSALADAREVLVLTPDLYLLPEAWETGREQVVTFLKTHDRLTVADARDLLGVSRKYLLPLLERLDAEGVTFRRGDFRVLAVSSPPVVFQNSSGEIFGR